MRRLRDLSDAYWTASYVDFAAAYRHFLGQHRSMAEYHVGELHLVCPPNIYHPGEGSSTRFTLRGLLTQIAGWGPRVLEVGAGSGAIGLSLARRGYDVTLLDIDPTAVACAQANAVRNHIQARVLQSDVFSAVPGERFDVILFNLPMLDKAIEDPLDLIACDQGGSLLSRFLSEAGEHLTARGLLYVSLSNLGNRQAILQSLERYTESIVYAEYFGTSGEWRWLVQAQLVQAQPV